VENNYCHRVTTQLQLIIIIIIIIIMIEKKVSATENATGTSNLRLKILCFALTLYSMCVSHEITQCLLLYTALTSWSLKGHAVCSM